MINPDSAAGHDNGMFSRVMTKSPRYLRSLLDVLLAISVVLLWSAWELSSTEVFAGQVASSTNSTMAGTAIVVDDPFCSGHGIQKLGTCYCYVGWAGAACSHVSRSRVTIWDGTTAVRQVRSCDACGSRGVDTAGRRRLT